MYSHLMTCVKKAGGAPTSNSRGQDQDLFCRWPRSGLVLPGQDPDLSRFGQDQDLFRRRPDFINSGSWPGWQNKSGSCQGARPRSGLIFLSPDLGLAPLARSALVARGHVDPYWREKKIENKSGSWPVPLGQDPDLKK